MENGELSVALILVHQQPKLYVDSWAWTTRTFLIQFLDQLVEGFGWKEFSVMEMNSQFLTVQTVDGVALKTAVMKMMWELLVQVSKLVNIIVTIKFIFIW